MSKFYYLFLGLIFILYEIGCSKKPIPTNIYDSEEYKSVTEKELIIGESVWATSCFRCHRYGLNNAVVYENKEYWDKAAEKGLGNLFESVWEGYKGENGAMPAKGFCNLCDEDEIRKSVIYTFHLARKAQKAQAKRDSLKTITNP
tara:strand:+ start:409 stop:843 length:435 start_codon:yes stop_codon:yes gene_type:complete